MNYLIVPGYGGSGDTHWQSRWAQANPNFNRVEQDQWDLALCSEWCAKLEAAVAQAGPDTVLIAHSLGCLLVAAWAQQTQLTVRGAMLVAVPDPQGAAFPADAIGFDDFPTSALPFPSLVIASSNDPYASTEFSERTAASWRSCYKMLGACGHINSDSGFGDWPAGLALLNTVLRRHQEYA